LVASDVDGTLMVKLQPPSERTRASVASVLAAGVPFVLVTGRPPRWVPPVAQHLPGIRYAVCANGAVEYDILQDRVLGGVSLEPEQLTMLADAAAEALPGCWLAVERLGTRAMDDAGMPRVEQGRKPDWASDFVEEPRERMLSEPAIKLLIRHNELSSDRMYAALSQRLGPGADRAVALTFSNPQGLLEAGAPGVSKATGLASVAARLGVAAADVIAFGDMPNDVEMLRWAGHGVAMGNSHPELLAAADEVTASASDDGVSLVLDRWF
jgi:hypothetical protein